MQLKKALDQENCPRGRKAHWLMLRAGDAGAKLGELGGNYDTGISDRKRPAKRELAKV